MTENALIDQLHAMVSVVLIISLPPLLGAIAVGLVIGILQAVTQVQDQSLPIAFKLLAVIMILVLFGR